MKFFLSLTLVLATTLSSAADPQEDLFRVTSQAGKLLSIRSQLSPLRINQIHSWELEIKNTDGSMVTGAVIEVSGGMPAHDHGLPTQPQITPAKEPGSYLVEGIRFHMPGEWELEFVINTATGRDSAKLEFSL